MGDDSVDIAVLREKIESMHSDVRDIKRLLAAQNGRVRKLEIWRGYMTGGLVLLGFMIGLLAKAVW